MVLSLVLSASHCRSVVAGWTVSCVLRCLIENWEDTSADRRATAAGRIWLTFFGCVCVLRAGQFLRQLLRHLSKSSHISTAHLFPPEHKKKGIAISFAVICVVAIVIVVITVLPAGRSPSCRQGG